MNKIGCIMGIHFPSNTNTIDIGYGYVWEQQTCLWCNKVRQRSGRAVSYLEWTAWKRKS